MRLKRRSDLPQLAKRFYGEISENLLEGTSSALKYWPGKHPSFGLVDFFFCLVGVLRRFQHCTGHITTGSWKGRGNQYIEFARVVYCKLPTNGKQLPAFPLKAVTGIEPPTSEVGGESVTTLPPWPPFGLVECLAQIPRTSLALFLISAVKQYL